MIPFIKNQEIWDMETAKKLSTLDDLLSHSEEERLELIRGHIVERGMPRFKHSHPQYETGAILNPFTKGNGDDGIGGWWILTEIGVFYDEQNSCIHDLAGWRRKRMPDPPDDSFIPINPDWVCEIMSPSNRKRDSIEKYTLLEKYQVPFYWIIDPDSEMIFTFELSNGKYEKTNIVRSGDKARLAPFEEIEFEVKTIFG